MSNTTKSSISLVASLVICIGCNSPSNTQAIKERTADATAAIKRDAGAVAQGIAEGLKRKGPLDINTASESQLEALPGISAKQAKAVIASRPYDDVSQLYKKHILTKAEFNRIHAQIVVK